MRRERDRRAIKMAKALLRSQGCRCNVTLSIEPASPNRLVINDHEDWCPYAVQHDGSHQFLKFNEDAR